MGVHIKAYGGGDGVFGTLSCTSENRPESVKTAEIYLVLMRYACVAGISYSMDLYYLILIGSTPLSHSISLRVVEVLILYTKST